MRRYLTAAADGNVTVSDKALSDHNGEAVLTIPTRGKRCSNNRSSLEKSDTSGSDHVQLTVSAGRLDDEPLSDVGFIKIDVEGHEQRVLRGAREIVFRDRPVMLIEILPEPTPLHREQTIREIEALGYESFVMLGSRLIMLRSVHDGRTALTAADLLRRASNNFIFLPSGRKAA
jgi:FkbM family methyltransferase